MSYFESESMVFCEAILPKEIAWEIMNRLGQMSCIHIIKTSIQKPNFENAFGNNLKRCQEILLKIKHIRLFLEQFSNRKLIECENYKQIFKQFENQIQNRNMQGYLYINQIEQQVSKIQNFLVNQKKQFDNNREAKTKMIQHASLLLTLTKSINLQSLSLQKNIDIQFNIQQDLDLKRKSSLKLEYRCGLINRFDQMLFKKIIFRISRGNAWVQTYQIPYDDVFEIFKSNQIEFIKKKLVFIIIFQSGQHYVIQQKINKVLSSIDCYLNPIKPNPSDLLEQLQDFKRRLQEHNTLQEITRQCIANYVDHMYQTKKGSKYSYLSYLQTYAKKELMIYKGLSNCDTSNNFLTFNSFIPVSRLQQLKNIKNKRQDLPSLIFSPKVTSITPPTHFGTFELIQIPQQIVNTYGIPTYKEFNPATLYIVTFGLFVGIMFGDVGHMLLGIAVMLYFKPNKWWWTVIFWMGYCGLIYNEFFGLNLGFSDSCYNINNLNQVLLKDSNCVCGFGLDPIWKVAKINNMQFINSFKMKLAVIIGVVHMQFGIIIRGINSFKKKNYLDLFTIVIPQFIFMTVTFVYMDFLIIFKWLTKWQKTAYAPSIINNMIQMFVGHSEDFYQIYSDEINKQKVLLIITFILIPLMLLGKPLYLYYKSLQNYANRSSPRGSQNQVLAEPNLKKQDPLAKQLQLQQQDAVQLIQKPQIYQFQEIIIHQIIQTIEFVLGAVSSTASYLRLWALSLAHSQLAQVFFELILSPSLEKGYSNIIALTILFYFYIAVTFFILVCMDVMECFLHSLRLHWVQFQNKFYNGNGYAFKPYSFENELKQN